MNSQLDSIRKFQDKKGFTDQQFADKLDIHRVSWQRIKNDRTSLSDKFLVRVHRAFPELGIFLPNDATKVTKSATDINTIRPQARRNKIWGGLVKLFRRLGNVKKPN